MQARSPTFRRSPLGSLPLRLAAPAMVALTMVAPSIVSPRARAATTASAQGIVSAFDQHFTGRTLRLDTFHTGGRGQEIVSLDEVRDDGPWAGPRGRLLDDSNLGKYRFEIVDLTTQLAIYAEGFASIYGEWETTAEAKTLRRTIHESIRFPEPRAPFQVRLLARGAQGAFHELFTTRVDPASRFVRRDPPVEADVTVLEEHGPPSTEVDLLFLAEGFREEERDAFLASARAATEAIFAVEPFASRRQAFNVRALFAPSAESGIDHPRAGVFRRTPLDCTFNSMDVQRYVLTTNNRAVRDLAAAAPYDDLVILVNERTYGGGGIYRLYATAMTRSAEFAYLVVHEFGHSFAGLGDEYYSSAVAYEDFTPPGTEPWEPNLTALLDPAKLKWKAFVAADTPLPTPWNKEAFDAADRDYQAKRKELRDNGASEEEVEALFEEVRRTSQQRLAAETYAGRVGAFEGAGYEPKGLYRPEVDCIMFTRNRVGFCHPCAAAIEQAIDRRTATR